MAKWVLLLKVWIKTIPYHLGWFSFLSFYLNVFRISDKGQLRSLNFSSDSQIVSIQRDLTSVDFVFLNQKISTDVQTETKQSCKKSGAEIRGLQWLADNYFGFITDQGLELYLLNHKRKSIKFLKSIIININWFLCYVGLFLKIRHIYLKFFILF